jgi:hypothetical protein
LNNILRAWKQDGGPTSVKLDLCRLCGLIVMTEMDRIKSGRRGVLHRDCANHLRSAVGRTNGRMLGTGRNLPLPPRTRGRQPNSEELKEHFRWLFLHKVGHISLGQLASLSGFGRSTIQAGIEAVQRLLPPIEIASKRFKKYLTALEKVGVDLP